MMKNALIAAALLALILCGCNGAQQEEMNSQIAAMKTEIAGMETELARVKAQVGNLKSELSGCRDELQALIDMWRATAKEAYINQARDITLKAISDAKANPRPLIRNGLQRGDWPCFLHASVEKDTGGPSQLNDFQGAAGLVIFSAFQYELENTPSLIVCGNEIQTQ